MREPRKVVFMKSLNAGSAFLLAIAFVVLPGCGQSTLGGGGPGGGGASAPSATVNGKIADRTLSPAYAIAAQGIDDPAYPNQISIILSNVEDLCGFLKEAADTPGLTKANLLDLALVLGATSATGSPVVAGTYSPNDNPGDDAYALTAGYNSLDANCMGNTGEATTGSVTLTSIGAVYSGTFDLMFGTDHVTGTFDAPFCEVGPIVGGGSGMVCQP